MKTIHTFFMLALFGLQLASAQVNQSASLPDYVIAYSSTEGDNRDIYLTNVAGSAKIKVTDFAGGNGYSAWSPDGKRIAFYAKYDDKKTWSIHTIHADGTNRKRLTDEVNHWDNSPTWSPDGSQIAFAKAFRDSEEKWQYQIWIMNADGTEQRQIEGLSGGGPYFSPSGQIVYHSQPGPSEIYIAHADGSNPRQLTHNEAEDWHPEVSPDGQRIAFMSNRDGNNEIYVMNQDGSDQKRLTFSEEEEDWYPSWSPEGTELLVCGSKNDGEERRIYCMKADGSDIRTVVRNGAQAAWLKLGQAQPESPYNFPLLEGPLMGQQPPGLVAEPFAPGIISTRGWEVEGVFAPGMQEFYFTTSQEEPFKPMVIGFRMENNVWKKFTEYRRNGETAFSPDGQRMHMAKGYKDRVGNGWSERKSLGPMFDRDDWGIMRLTASSKGTYVFDDYKSNDVIRISTLQDSKRQPPELMGPIVNSGEYTAHPFIAPDESYLIWDSKREEGFGDSDLYISFKQADGSWGPAMNMGEEINTDQWEAYASVTSDGKYMLFNRGVDTENDNTDIYWVDAKIIEKLRLKQLSQLLASTPHPIAYGSNGISLSNADGSSQVKLTNGDHGYPAWAADGKKLAFYGYHDNKKTWSIHMVNSDGTNEKRLTHAKHKLDNMPAWSYDGTQIVFAREYWDAAGVRQYELWVMNADGSEERQLKALRGGGPRFLPDGRLLYHSEYADKESEISIADLDGRHIVHLTDNEAEEWDPKLSPDGKQIVFTSNRDGNHEVYVMNIDGSDQRRLTNNDIDDYGPVWSPDGEQILFQSKGDGAKEEDPTGLYIMNKDGSAKRRIVANGWQPAWYNLSEK